MKHLARSVLLVLVCAMLISGTSLAESPQYPFSDENGEPIKLTWFCELHDAAAAVLKNRGESEAYAYWEDKFGLDIEWEHPSGDYNNAFNLMIASGEYPDIIENPQWLSYPGGPDQAIEDGVIIDLTEYVEQYCPNLMAYFEKDPMARYQLTSSEGKIWAFSKIFPDEDPWYGVEIRQDLLDRFNLEMPETIDDWYTVLKTFKENGIESPLDVEQATFDTYGCFIGAWDILKNFYVHQDQTIHYGPIEDAYKDFLTTMNQWYEEGLINPEFASIDTATRSAKRLNDTFGAWAGSVAEALGTPNATMKANGDEEYLVVGAPYPKLNDESDAPRFRQNSFPVRNYYVAISSSCEYVEEICTALDWLVSDEGSFICSFGFENVSYTLDENGDPQLTELITNDPDGNPRVNMMCKYAMHFGPFLCDSRESELLADDEHYIAAGKTWKQSASADGNLPPFKLTADESMEYSAIMAEINTYVDEMFLKFIMGLEPLENYDAYVQRIQDMGIQDALDIQNDAYARYVEFLNGIE